jgi:hypothetical protein
MKQSSEKLLSKQQILAEIEERSKERIKGLTKLGLMKEEWEPSWFDGAFWGAELAVALMLQHREGHLRNALQAWLDWEAEQIKKEGPYCGKKINELIAEGTAVLASVPAWESEGGE